MDVPFNYLGTPDERAARGYTPPANVMPDTPWVDSSGRDWRCVVLCPNHPLSLSLSPRPPPLLLSSLTHTHTKLSPRTHSYFGWKGRQPDTQAAVDSSGGATSSLPDFPCKDQAAWGKCGEWFMAGKCNRSCGRCDAQDGSCTDERPSGAMD